MQLQVNASAPSDPYSFQEIGSVSFHLHDIIQASPISGIYDIWENNVLVGDLELEITFSYGSYGYGTSSQVFTLYECDFARIPHMNSIFFLSFIKAQGRKYSRRGYGPILSVSSHHTAKGTL